MSVNSKVGGDKVRLIASIGFNLVAKGPSLLNLLFILPLISRTLGTALYGEFLAMLALGSTLTLLFGGINAVGRRHLAAAFGSRDSRRETAAVSDTIACSAIATLISVTAAAAIASRTATTSSLVLVALLPIIGAFANTFDNLRAAYNQHYVTAILQTISQSAIYGWAIYHGIAPGSVIVAALVLQLPSILASVATLLLLIWERPHLRRLHAPQNIRAMFRSASYVTLSDGAIFTALNASLYSLGVLGATNVAAWYGTLMRAFQTLLAPALIILLPITSFTALRWVSWSSTQRVRAIRLVVGVSIMYGGTVALTFALGASFYLTMLFPDVPRFGTIHLVCLAFFFAAIVTQKVYGQFVFAVAEARSFSLGTFAIVLVALGGAALALTRLDPLHALDILALGIALPLLILIVADQLFRRGTITG